MGMCTSQSAHPHFFCFRLCHFWASPKSRLYIIALHDVSIILNPYHPAVKLFDDDVGGTCGS